MNPRRRFPLMNLLLRPAIEADSDDLLRWRNDPETRLNSINPALVSREEHAGWLARVLADPRQQVLIAKLDGVSVGVIRLEWTDDRESCDLSLTVAPEHRGKGCGSAMVGRAIREIRSARVCAEVKLSNAASLRVFEKLGFRVIDSQGDLLMLARDLDARSASIPKAS